MARQDTDLPFGDAFSPAQLETKKDSSALSTLLALVTEYQGQPYEFDKEIAERFFYDSNDSLTRAKNVRLGMGPSGYGLVDDQFEFTDFGQELNQIRDDREKLHNRFSRYILLQLDGLKILELVEDLRAAGKQTTNSNVKQGLREQYDMHIDKTSNHWSQMRAWLSEAGLVNTGSHRYEIEWSKIEDLTGMTPDNLLDLDGLTDEQRAFLHTLAILDPNGYIQNSAVRKVAEEIHGINISQSNISDRTLNPLEDLGYIEWENPSEVTGKPNLVRTTNQFDAEVLDPVLGDVTDRVGIPRHVLRLSFEEVTEQLNSNSTYKKGVALETLAIKVGRLLGLDFAGWRVRGQKTGGAEVDVVMDSIANTFNRWQIQCKNTQSQVRSKHIAREVGLSRTLQTNTILMIARGGVTGDGKQFAARIMQHENLSILFIDDSDLQNLDTRPDKLLETLRGESKRIQRYKSLSLDDDQTNKERDPQEVLDEYEDEIKKATEDTDKILDLSNFSDKN